jgi:hypothetical protein
MKMNILSDKFTEKIFVDQKKQFTPNIKTLDFTELLRKENHMKLLHFHFWTRRFDSEYVYCYFEKLSG